MKLTWVDLADSTDGLKRSLEGRFTIKFQDNKLHKKPYGLIDNFYSAPFAGHYETEEEAEDGAQSIIDREMTALTNDR